MTTPHPSLSDPFSPGGGDMVGDILAHPLLGGGLPAEAARHLHRAALNYPHDDVAETHLEAAEVAAPGHVAVVIAWYRYYFYKGRLIDALRIARQCVGIAMRENVLGDDWRAVRAQDAAFGEWDAIIPRFFLFSLKGYAYLSLRLGRHVDGREAAEKLVELDPRDRIGARLLLDVLDRQEAGDEE